MFLLLNPGYSFTGQVVSFISYPPVSSYPFYVYLSTVFSFFSWLKRAWEKIYDTKYGLSLSLTLGDWSMLKKKVKTKNEKDFDS